MADRVVLVVGAGPGLGSSVAHRFARAGYDVALVGRREETVRAIGRSLQAGGTRARWTAVDVGDERALETALAPLVTEAGRIDVLHHNVSTYRAATATQTTAADLLADLAVGVGSLLTAVRAVLPALLGADRPTVLATGSGVADRPMTGAASLGVQKAALRNLVQALDAELGPRGVRAATLTVRGVLERGTPYDPDLVAGALLALAEAPRDRQDAWQPVVDYSPVR